jgi:hypothetical protein
MLTTAVAQNLEGAPLELQEAGAREARAGERKRPSSGLCLSAGQGHNQPLADFMDLGLAPRAHVGSVGTNPLRPAVRVAIILL